jgi:hypothetical protein
MVTGEATAAQATYRPGAPAKKGRSFRDFT